jgi:hypothetical protein
MAQISQSDATLIIGGDDLIPVQITKLLGCEPDFSHAKNDEVKINNTGNTRIANTGMWQIRTKRLNPENLDAQISEIFNKLSPDMSIWKSLNNKYKINLFCGIFMKEGNEGMSISPVSLKILSDRGVRLDLDIYGPNEENA